MATTAVQLANDRFKAQFAGWFWEGVAIAAILHFLMFAFWPQMSTLDFQSLEHIFTTIELPPDIQIPPPPASIARPATPQVSDAAIDDDITIGSTTFADNPVSLLPPPPAAATSAAARGDLSSAPQFTPTTVAPELKNPAAARAAAERNYPPLLRDAGIGGRPIVWLFLSEEGRVLKKQISVSSGYPQFDEAALKVADIMQFSPAFNRDRKVPVWVQIEIVFTVK